MTMPQDKTENWKRKLETLATLYPEHPLLAELKIMAERYQKLERRLCKVALISDRLQGEMIQLNRSLENMALTDSLTGLLNRHAMNQRLQSEWNRLQREDIPFGLLMLDIDHFKRINDTFGHAVGDQVLAELAKRLMEMTRNYDACCRWGGEEFLILLSNADYEGIETVYRKLHQSLLDNPVSLDDGQLIPMTFSAGANLVLANSSLDKSIKLTDEALYRAKRKGRNCMVWTAKNTDNKKIRP